jgi:flavocytochrome c
VAVHGIGAGLKILLSRSELVAPSLSRDDIVALMNVVHKFSDSIELVNRFEAPQTSLKEVALTEVKRLGSKLTAVQRDGLVHAILSEESNVMLLAKNLIGDPHMSFVRHALIYLGLEAPDCIVIGGGLAGLVTALSVAERGGSVTIIEKQSALGGNSAKASSGINSVRSNRTEDIEEFFVDTVKSQNHLGVEQLAHILVERANVSVAWLERVSGVALNSVGQLGGHRFARTWKPEHGLVGAEIMGGLIRAVKKSFPSIQVLTASRVVELVQSEETVQGVRLADGRELHARTVVLASGGFGFDTSGLIQAYRPDLVSFPTTLGSQTTGDGIKLAVSVGADLMDMQHVQLHPTGFIDPADRDNRVKVLAAEILRGIGGILLDENGNRFVNELGTRKHVTDVMLEKCKGKSERCAFTILIGERSVDAAENILRVYQNRGLLKRVSRSELSENVLTTLKEYSVSDKFGRVDKQGIPIDTNEWFLIGQVTPVVHYTMGGVRVDTQGRVTRMDGSVIQGLFAVGEVTGGVHGENRLGGNSLLECTVYGRIIGGSSVPVVTELTPSHFPRQPVHVTVKAPVVVRTMKLAEVEAHATVDDCWTVIEHKVYDLSRYADEHPGGAAAVRESCGKDATQRFLAAHSLGLLDDVGFESIGNISRE